MSKLRSFARKLDPYRVAFAKQVEQERLKLARQAVLERAKKDAEFAADVLKAVGDALPKEIKEACEESVKSHAPIVGGDLTHELVPVQTDGGGEILVHPTELPDYPTDGPNSAIDLTEKADGDEPPLDIIEKLVQEEGPKVEKA